MAQSSYEAPSYELLWEASLGDPAAAQPDQTIWNFDIGDGTAAGIPGWGNLEREYYIPEAVTTGASGEIVITSNRLPSENPYPVYYGGNAEWSSAKLTTFGKVHFLYGRIEAQLELPVGVGTWPAFWMLGASLPEVGWPQCGEIDIMEHRGDQPNRLYTTIHGPGYCGDSGKGQVFDYEQPLAEGSHNFAVNWLPGSIEWQVDGVTQYQLTPDDVAPNPWVFDTPHYVIVNLAMGGNFCGPIAPDLNQARYAIKALKHSSIDGVGSVIHP